MEVQDRELERYISDISDPEELILKELDRETNLHAVQPRMISGHIQGRFLKMLTQMLRPKNILEIGTFTGYSTLCFAAGLDDEGVIDTIEVNDEIESIAAAYFARSEHRDKIRQHTGSALDIAPMLGKVYDIIFIDGDKREYPEYYKMIMGGKHGDEQGRKPLVRSGSIILADNILWYGKVAEPVRHNDLYTQRIVEFNQMVRDDIRVENVVVPIRDGLNLIRIK